MAVTDSQTEHVGEIEAALLDAEPFMKYHAPERAIKRLKTALELNSRSIKVRERLREAKQLYHRINSAGGLEAIRRARRPDLKPVPAAEPVFERKHFTLAGDLSAVSVFDAMQVIENARLDGVLTLNGVGHQGQVKFSDGRIVDASCGGDSGEKGFQRVVEITSGTFEFQKTSEQYLVRIQALSNTNLILDTLRLLDEQKQ